MREEKASCAAGRFVFIAALYDVLVCTEPQLYGCYRNGEGKDSTDSFLGFLGEIFIPFLYRGVWSDIKLTFWVETIFVHHFVRWKSILFLFSCSRGSFKRTSEREKKRERE